MRLINADKLIYQSHAQHLEPYINKKDIDNAPTVEMAEDCVKREDVKKFLYERLDRLNDDELYDIFSRIIDDMYNELPSVTPQTRWTPVSEEFPKHKDILVMDKEEDMFVAWYESEGLHEGWHSTDNRFDYDTPIIAWMPLPQPYTESEDAK